MKRLVLMWLLFLSQRLWIDTFKPCNDWYKPGPVFMQVVPLGTAWAVEICYARLARNVGSKYRIEAKERSLIENYNKDDMVIIRDPVALKGKDWSLMNVYLKKRICLNTPGCVVLASQEEEIWRLLACISNKIKF